MKLLASIFAFLIMIWGALFACLFDSRFRVAAILMMLLNLLCYTFIAVIIAHSYRKKALAFRRLYNRRARKSIIKNPDGVLFIFKAATVFFVAVLILSLVLPCAVKAFPYIRKVLKTLTTPESLIGNNITQPPAQIKFAKTVRIGLRNSTGLPAPHVIVILESSESECQWGRGAITDQNGFVRFNDVEFGRCNVVALDLEKNHARVDFEEIRIDAQQWDFSWSPHFRKTSTIRANLDGFIRDDAGLMPEHTNQLSRFAREISRSGITFVLGGTDSNGSQDYNDQVGGERAVAVCAFLQRSGIAAQQVQAISMGKRYPATRNYPTGTPLNRRVECVFIPLESFSVAVRRPHFPKLDDGVGAF